MSHIYVYLLLTLPMQSRELEWSSKEEEGRSLIPGCHEITRTQHEQAKQVANIL